MEDKTPVTIVGDTSLGSSRLSMIWRMSWIGELKNVC